MYFSHIWMDIGEAGQPSARLGASIKMEEIDKYTRERKLHEKGLSALSGAIFINGNNPRRCIYGRL
jgi:hypothetical protein